MRWEQTVEFAALSDVGIRRQNNQDSCVSFVARSRDEWRERGHLFIVADGMGGHAVGDLASKLAVDTIPLAYFKDQVLEIPEALRKAIVEANGVIHTRGQQNREFLRMGTTCTALVLGPQGAVAGHVGDSRLYRIRDQRIDQLTFDHSLQWELSRHGGQKPGEALSESPRNVITRSLGPEPQVKVDVEGPYPVLPGDIYLLCSDGLSTLVSDEEIGMIARELPPVDACRLLVDLANLRGGSDNITVVIAKVGALPAGLPREEATLPPRFAWAEWLWLGAEAVLGILLVAAVALTLFGDPVAGVVLGGVVLFGVAGLFYAWFRLPRPRGAAELAKTILWRPYCTASARLTRKFLSRLVAHEVQLQQLARDEEWPVDWAAHDPPCHRARQALVENDLATALRELARAVHLLMLAMQIERKRINHVAKWGLRLDPGESAAESDPSSRAGNA